MNEEIYKYEPAKELFHWTSAELMLDGEWVPVTIDAIRRAAEEGISTDASTETDDDE